MLALAGKAIEIALEIEVGREHLTATVCDNRHAGAGYLILVTQYLN